MFKAILIAILSAPFAVAFAAEGAEAVSKPSRDVVIQCDKMIEDEDSLHVSRVRLVFSANGATEAAIVEGELRRSADDDVIDRTDKVFLSWIKCEGVQNEPLQFFCSTTDTRSRVASLKGEGQVLNGKKVFIVTRVDRNSTVKQFEFAANQCVVK